MSTFLSKWDHAPLMDVVELHDSRRVPLNHTQRAARKGPYPYYGANGQVDSVDDYLFEGEFVLLAEDGGYFDNPSRGVAYEVTGRFGSTIMRTFSRPNARYCAVSLPTHSITRIGCLTLADQLD